MHIEGTCTRALNFYMCKCPLVSLRAGAPVEPTAEQMDQPMVICFGKLPTISDLTSVRPRKLRLAARQQQQQLQQLQQRKARQESQKEEMTKKEKETVAKSNSGRLPKHAA